MWEAMNKVSPSYRTDEQLEAIFHETGDWVVNGKRGIALCSAPSLGCAMERAIAHISSRRDVIAITRLPDDNIVVFPGQIKRLARLIKEHETGPEDGALAFLYQHDY